MSVETWGHRDRANIEIIAIKINSKHKGNKTEGRVETRQAEIKLVPGEKRSDKRKVKRKSTVIFERLKQ